MPKPTTSDKNKLDHYPFMVPSWPQIQNTLSF